MKKKQRYRILRKKARHMGAIGFTLYDITKHSIDLLCNDLIGAEGIYIYAVGEKMGEYLKERDFIKSIRIQIEEPGEVEYFFSINKKHLKEVLKMLVEAETDYANIIESDAQEETLCQYCFSICRYPMWKFLKEGNIISMMEIYFDYNRPVTLDIGYYFDDKYERPCLKGKYYVPSTAI